MPERSASVSFVDVPRPVLAPTGRNADQLGKVDPFVNCFRRQVEDVDEALIPDAQAQVLVKDADTLRQAGHDGFITPY